MTSEPSGQPSVQPDPQPEIILARWGTRFWAWLVDFIIVTIAAEILFAIAYAPLEFTHGLNFGGNSPPWVGGARYAIQSLMFFAYWTYFESSTGQSIGKKLLKIKTTDLSGGTPNVKSAAIQGFGKAFLLPIDVLLGWIFINQKRQRLLSKAGDTIVIKLTDEGGKGATNYRKD
jgi:uncharacterized RDD family membrane protein YckC